MAYTPEQIQLARQELARRELQRRQQSQQSQEPQLPEIPDFQAPEQTGLSGIASDAAQIPMNLLQYAMTLPGKIKESGGQLQNNKMRALQNLLAGAGNFAKGTINLPYDLNRYLSRKNLLPEFAQKHGNLLPHIPEDTGLQKAFMGEQQPGDELLQLLPQLAMGKPFARMAAAEIPATRKFASLHLKDAQKQAIKEGATAPGVSHEVIDNAAKYLRDSNFNINDKALSDMVEKAKQGDYRALFALQSDVGKAARNLKKSSSGAERNLGMAGDSMSEDSLRQMLLKDFRDSLSKEGFKDIASKMKKGQTKYRQYNWINDNVYKQLTKFGIPLSVMGALGWGANQMFSNKNQEND